MFFFFKQKTAYEMRISDWSSDVCSSDLAGFFPTAALQHRCNFRDQRARRESQPGWDRTTSVWLLRQFAARRLPSTICFWRCHEPEVSEILCCEIRRRRKNLLVRSEEHTSELQSLMRISYAVFCLKQ